MTEINLIHFYEELVKLKDDPEQFDRRFDEIWEEIYQTLPPEAEKRARQFNWQLHGQLDKIKDPMARYNKMVELFWQGVQTFQLALTNPDALIARSQDGSKAVVLPIDRK